MITGIKVDPSDPFYFEFIVDTKDQGDIDETEAQRLVNYFLAVLSIPGDDLWVNLSPYERDRIIPQNLSYTDLGRDMLTQDYVLKQLAASLTYPETELGEKYWKAVNANGANKVSQNDVTSLFSKVWVLPKKAHVIEYGNTAVISELDINVLRECDYLAMQKNNSSTTQTDVITKGDSFEELIMPVIRDDVNHGENFARLRQFCNAFALAVWFKRKVKDSIYAYYIDQQKINGIELNDKTVKEQVYALYTKAFTHGAYNYVKREPISANRYSNKRYVSGGIELPEEIVTSSVATDEQMREATVNAGDTVVRGSVKPITRRQALQLGAVAVYLGSFSLTAGSVYKGLTLGDNMSSKRQARESQKRDSGITQEQQKMIIDDIKQSDFAVGQYVKEVLINLGDNVAPENTILDEFIRRLNVSDWLGASLSLEDTFFDDLKQRLSIMSSIDTRANTVYNLLLLLQEVRDDYKALGSDKYLNIGELVFFRSGVYPIHWNGKGIVEEDDLRVFGRLETLNMLSRKASAKSMFSGAPVTVSQGHNWAYFGWHEAKRQGFLPQKYDFLSTPQEKLGKGIKTTLVHYDAHRDLGDANSLDMLSDSDDRESQAEIAQRTDIARFITPAIFDGTIDEMVWVVPPEAVVKGDNYVPSAGTYELEVGISEKSSGIVVRSRKDGIADGVIEYGVKNGETMAKGLTRTIKLHVIPASTDTSTLQKMRQILNDTNNILLDIDEDVFGSDNPFASIHLPQYRTGSARQTEILKSIKYASAMAGKKTKAVTIAHSPNYRTSGLDDITFRLLDTLLDPNAEQPDWVWQECGGANVAKRGDGQLVPTGRLQTSEVVATFSMLGMGMGGMIVATKMAIKDSDEVGGILLNQEALKLSTDSKINFHVYPELIEDMQESTGLEFNIFAIESDPYHNI